MRKTTFKILKGIKPSHIEELVRYSLSDPLILKFTSDKVRFGSLVSFEKWKKKGRLVYTLKDEGEHLLGLIWFGKKELPKMSFSEKILPFRYPFTFAIRVYGSARGKGYSLWFMKKVLTRFKNETIYQKSPNKGLWLVTSTDNIRAVKIYSKYGFREVTEADEKEKMVMVLDRVG